VTEAGSATRKTCASVADLSAQSASACQRVSM
jgi:hypothetical protein